MEHSSVSAARNFRRQITYGETVTDAQKLEVDGSAVNSPVGDARILVQDVTIERGIQLFRARRTDELIMLTQQL